MIRSTVLLTAAGTLLLSCVLVMHSDARPARRSVSKAPAVRTVNGMPRGWKHGSPPGSGLATVNAERTLFWINGQCGGNTAQVSQALSPVRDAQNAEDQLQQLIKLYSEHARNLTELMRDE